MVNYQPGIQGYLVPMLPWLNNPTVTEICLSEAKKIWIEEQGIFKQVVIPELDNDYLRYFSQLVAGYNKKVLCEEQPLLSGMLPGGSRIQLVTPPISKEVSFAIRKHTTRRSLLIDFEKKYFFTGHNELIHPADKLLQLYKNKYYCQFIQESILAKKNILIAGGTASGKTTFMKACLAEIPLSERIILLEDTPELQCPQNNKLALLIKEDIGIDMQKLVKTSLRLRPDRILIGEIRGKEILDFLGACGSGHDGGIATIHAGSIPMAWMRLVQLYKQNNVPAMQDEEILRELKLVIDIIVLIKKTKEGRKITEVYYKEFEERK